MAFDLCGIACGHFLLPFSTFFGATFIGKAIIKVLNCSISQCYSRNLNCQVNMQALFFITLFNERYLSRLVTLARGTVPFVADALQEFLLKQKVVAVVDALLYNPYPRSLQPGKILAANAVRRIAAWG